MQKRYIVYVKKVQIEPVLVIAEDEREAVKRAV